MTSNQEYLLNEIHTEVTQSNLWPIFNAQLKKMNGQKKCKYLSVCERWEYALHRVKGGKSLKKVKR